MFQPVNIILDCTASHLTKDVENVLCAAMVGNSIKRRGNAFTYKQMHPNICTKKKAKYPDKKVLINLIEQNYLSEYVPYKH